MKRFHRSQVAIHVLILLFLILGLYLPTISNGFVLDDHNGIEKNEYIRSFDTIFISPPSFLRFFILHITYVFGGTDPAVYRMVNVLFHVGATISLYTLLTLLTTGSVAIFSALLFAVHPILVESVIWPSSQTYPQYSMFIFLTLIFYILIKRGKRKVLFITSFFLSFLLAIMSSEKAFVLPFILLVYEGLFGSIKKNWKPLLGFFAVLLGGFLLTLPFIQSRIQAFQGSYAEGGGGLFLNPLVQIPYVLGTYIQLTFLPIRLTIYHLDELGVVPAAIVFNTFLILAFIGTWIVSFKKNKLICFFLSLFFVANLPAIIPIHVIQIAAERYAYLGTAGLITSFVLALNVLFKRFRFPIRVMYVLLVLMVGLLMWRTYIRSLDWTDEMSLRRATLRDAPYSARAHNNVGIQLMNEGNYSEALEEYKSAIRLKSDYSHPYHNIGHMLAVTKRYKEAVPYYQKAQQLNPYTWQTYQDLGQVYFLLGMYGEAKPQLLKAIELGTPEVKKMQIILQKIRELEDKK